MRTLYKQLLDGQISRREFVQELALLGVSAASVSTLISSVADAAETDSKASGHGRTVTGNGADLLAESLRDANVQYFFHGCGAGINRFFDSFVTRPEFKNFLATNEGQCVAIGRNHIGHQADAVDAHARSGEIQFRPVWHP